MAHIEDRWHRHVIGADGKRRRVKTDLYGTGMRYRVRYIDPMGKERSKSFPDKGKHEAEAFMVQVEHAKRSRTYVDPESGRVGFSSYADSWMATRTVDESTKDVHRSRIENHLKPFFGDRPIDSIKPESINEWNTWAAQRYEESTRAVSFVILKAIFSAAVDNQRLAVNPCDGKTVTVPKQRPKKVVPWPRSNVHAVRGGLPSRYQAMIDVAAGCGLRQGEIFGLAAEDIDVEGGIVYVRRQVKRVRALFMRRASIDAGWSPDGWSWMDATAGSG